MQVGKQGAGGGVYSRSQNTRGPSEKASLPSVPETIKLWLEEIELWRDGWGRG